MGLGGLRTRLCPPSRIGMFLDNTRRRADKLTPERRAELDALGVRW